jgi:hypothetical protein
MLVITINRDFYIFKESKNKIELLNRFIQEQGKSLELFHNFENVWKEVIWPIIQNENENEILLVVGSQAGFTDARIISIWLNSLNVFCKENKIKIAKYLEYNLNIDQEDYIINNIAMIKDNLTWIDALDSLIYTREPTIGHKL